VTSLTDALKDVEMFLAKAQSLSDVLHGTDLASLSINVEDCSRDIAGWVKEAEGMVSGLTKSWFKKFVAAVKKQNMRDIFYQIGSHKSTIMLSLSATGRYVFKILLTGGCAFNTFLNSLLDAYNCAQSDILVSKVGEATSYGEVTVEALSRLESMTEFPKIYKSDALNTRRSLSSIASAVSRIESLVSQQFGPASPYTMNTANPQVAGDVYHDFHDYQQTSSKPLTPVHTPLQELFLTPQYSNYYNVELKPEMPFNIEAGKQVMDDALPIRGTGSVLSEDRESGIVRTAKRKRIEEDSEASLERFELNHRMVHYPGCFEKPRPPEQSCGTSI
jgi:hypothetical protein